MTGALQRIHSFERFGIILGLERMERLMELLGRPGDGINYIHVAGTNGKGSVCRFIYEALRAEGYETGLYTSPFIRVFNERIEFDGRYISDEDLEICADEVLRAADSMVAEGFDSPTEFEIVTAIAFVYFSKKKADYVVLEVGLGGRGDSTNIIKKPLISIITSISFDHMDRLGDTLEKIAGEKAGIIKRGAPVVSNVAAESAAAVIMKAAHEAGAELYDVSGYECRNVRKTRESYVFDADICGTEYDDIEITMIGEHQMQNAMTALAALDVLRSSGAAVVSGDAVRTGFKRARQPGRFEILRKDPYFIIDGAHNEAGAEALENTMKAHFSGKKTLMVTGVLADKDVDAILRHFYGIADDFIATEPENERKLTAGELENAIISAGKSCEAVPDPIKAYQRALELSGKYDVILFAGSLYLLGKIMGAFYG